RIECAAAQPYRAVDIEAAASALAGKVAQAQAGAVFRVVERAAAGIVAFELFVAGHQQANPLRQAGQNQIGPNRGPVLPAFGLVPADRVAQPDEAADRIFLQGARVAEKAVEPGRRLAQSLIEIRVRQIEPAARAALLVATGPSHQALLTGLTFGPLLLRPLLLGLLVFSLLPLRPRRLVRCLALAGLQRTAPRHG